jgi:Flp pilus assembly pilin Flp
MNKLHTAVATRLALAFAGLATPTVKREEGQTFVEYAMILALVAVLLVVALTFLHDQIANAYTHIGNTI